MHEDDRRLIEFITEIGFGWLLMSPFVILLGVYAARGAYAIYSVLMRDAPWSLIVGATVAAAWAIRKGIKTINRRQNPSLKNSDLTGP